MSEHFLIMDQMWRLILKSAMMFVPFCSPTFDLSIYDSMWISIGHSKQDIEFELLNKEINQ